MLDSSSSSSSKTRVSSLNLSLKGLNAILLKCFKNMLTNKIVAKIMLNEKKKKKKSPKEMGLVTFVC